MLRFDAVCMDTWIFIVSVNPSLDIKSFFLFSASDINEFAAHSTVKTATENHVDVDTTTDDLVSIYI